MRFFDWAFGGSIARGIITGFVGLVLVFGLLGGCTAVACKAAYETSKKQTTLRVDHKERVIDNGESAYRVYTDKGVYVVKDTFLYWNWRAADRYAELKQGHYYVCTQIGWRVGFFSAFPNLIECEPA